MSGSEISPTLGILVFCEIAVIAMAEPDFLDLVSFFA